EHGRRGDAQRVTLQPRGRLTSTTRSASWAVSLRLASVAPTTLRLQQICLVRRTRVVRKRDGPVVSQPGSFGQASLFTAILRPDAAHTPPTRAAGVWRRRGFAGCGVSIKCADRPDRCSGGR